MHIKESLCIAAIDADGYLDGSVVRWPREGRGNKCRDGYNISQSLTRISIEQAFGYFMCRWEILGWTDAIWKAVPNYPRGVYAARGMPHVWHHAKIQVGGVGGRLGGPVGQQWGPRAASLPPEAERVRDAGTNEQNIGEQAAGLPSRSVAKGSCSFLELYDHTEKKMKTSLIVRTVREGRTAMAGALSGTTSLPRPSPALHAAPPDRKAAVLRAFMAVAISVRLSSMHSRICSSKAAMILASRWRPSPTPVPAPSN